MIKRSDGSNCHAVVKLLTSGTNVYYFEIIIIGTEVTLVKDKEKIKYTKFYKIYFIQNNDITLLDFYSISIRLGILYAQ